MEEGRLSQFQYECWDKLEDLEGPISADNASTRLTFVRELQTKWTSELEAILALNAIKIDCNLKWNDVVDVDLTEEEMLAQRIDALSMNQRKLSDKMRVNTIKLRLIFRAQFDDAANQLKTFLEKGMEAFSGRPHQISTVTSQWDKMKKLKGSLQEVLYKCGYIFTESDLSTMKTQIEAIYVTWKTLKSLRKENEKESTKMTCKVCVHDDVKYVLNPCGHPFCGSCLERLTSCPICRGSVSGKIKLHF